MTQQRTPRPVGQLAAAIYGSCSLSPSDEAEALALGYRDRLRQLTQLGMQHREFVAYAAGAMPTSQALEPDTVVLDAFRAAQDALQGEQLAKLDPGDIHRQLDQHLRHISTALAQEFLTALEREVEEKRVGQLRTVGASIARCTLPVRTRSQQFDDPLAAMMHPSDDEPTASTAMEFFVAQDVLLANAGRSVRRYRPLRLIFERATPPLRRFLRLVTGKRYRAAGELAEGQLSAVVLFHYVLDYWADDDQQLGPIPAGPRSRRSWPAFRHFSMARASVIPLLAIATLAIAVIGLDYRQAVQVAALKRQVHALERKLTDGSEASDTESLLSAETNPGKGKSQPDQFPAVVERLATLDEQLARTAREINLRLVALGGRIDALERDGANGERLTERQRQLTGPFLALRKDIESLRENLKATEAAVTGIRATAVTSKQLAEVKQHVDESTSQFRTETLRFRTKIDAATNRAATRLDALEKLLLADTHPSRTLPSLNTAQMRKSIQHTPSQRVLDELHRLMRSVEPYEACNRSDLMKERWKLLWSTSATVPYITRTTILLQEISRLSEYKELKSETRDQMLRDQCELLAALPPTGTLADTDALVAVTVQADAFSSRFSRASYSSSHRDTHRYLTSLVKSVGSFVEAQRLTDLKKSIGRDDPLAITRVNW